MGKLTGYILGVTAAVVIGYYSLSLYYSALLHWLTPYFGSGLVIVMGLMFLFMGDPLHWPVLLGVWVLLGVIVGIGSRKGRKAVGAAIAVYVTVSGIMGLALASLFISFGGAGSINLAGGTGLIQSLSSGTLAPPPGTNLYSILTEPIIGRFISAISVITSSFSLGGLSVNPSVVTQGLPGGGSIYPVVERVLLLFIPYIIANFVIFVVVAGIAGKYTNRILDPSSVKKKRKKSSGTVIVVVAVAVLLIASLVPVLQGADGHNTAQHAASGSTDEMSMLVGSSSPFFMAPLPSHYLSGIYSDSQAQLNLSNVSGINYAAGVVGSYGDTYGVYGYLQKTNSTTFSGWAGDARRNSSIFTMIAVSANLTDLAGALESDNLFGLSQSFATSSGIGGEFNRYLNLIPPVAIVEDFPGSYNTTVAVATREASSISSSLNDSGVSLLASFTIPGEYISNVSVNATLYLYGAGSANVHTTYDLLKSISPYIPSTGSFPMFMSGLRSGYLVPGAHLNSTESSLFVTGYVNSTEVAHLISGSVGIGNASKLLGSSIVFAGGIFQKGNVFHSPPYRQTISAAEIMGSNTTMTFPSNSTIYGLSFAYPVENVSSGSLNYNYSSYSSYEDVPVSAIGTSTPSIINYTSRINLGSLYFETDATFPAELNVSITYSMVNGTVAMVNTTISSQSSSNLKNFTISEYAIMQDYPGLVTLVSGSTNFSQPSLGTTPAGFSYELRFRNPGAYVMPPPQISYVLDGHNFSYAYTDPTIVVPYPDVFSTINSLEYSSAAIIAYASGAHILVYQLIPGFYFFDLIPIALILIDIPLEYHWYRKIMAARRKTGSSQP
ncbi:MAG: hypothetical protein QXN26_04965 [Thermoplasmataceae archaeon]